MTHPYPQAFNGQFDHGPPNGGIPPGNTPFHAAHPSPSSPPSRPGGQFHGHRVEHQGVRALFPLHRAVFHVMDEAFMKSPKNGYMEPWEFPTGLSVKDFCVALGIRGGITECHETGNGRWMKGQTFLPGDARAEKKMEEIGWVAGRGVTSKPIWVVVL